MRAYHLEKLGSVEGIVLREDEMPKAGPHDVLVRVRAISINRRDTSILNGTYPLAAKPDIVPISDGAGEVVAIGEAVRRFKVGDRVTSHYFAYWRDGRVNWDIGVWQTGCTLPGMLAEFVAVNEEMLVRAPEHLSWLEAATLPCAAVTAWSSLFGPEPVCAGQTVLTLGTGGVSIFALQFAKAAGARVISTTSSNAKAERLRELGADEVVNYRTHADWHRVVLELTQGRGADVVVETGGADTLDQSIRAAALYANIAVVAAVGSRKPVIEIDPAMFNRSLVTLRRIFVGSRASFEAMNRAISHSRIRPVIDRVFSFAEVREAYRYFADGHQFGKVAIEI